MRIGLVYDPYVRSHCDVTDHPECPDRVDVIFKRILDVNLHRSLIPIKSRVCTEEELKIGHSNRYINRINKQLHAPLTLREIYMNDYTDVYANEHTYDVAKLAVGSVLNAVKSVARNRCDSAVVLCRPPGHHATVNNAGGFCIFNNVAIGALYAQKKFNKRVCIIDWDIHHGNGTEDIIKQRGNDILFVSVHRYGDFYPNTGKASYKNIMNIPVAGDKVTEDNYLDIMQKKIIPRVTEYAPDIIIVSCGFDACVDDPIVAMDDSDEKYGLLPRTYYMMTSMLKEVCPNIILALEGGYNLNNIPLCMERCIHALM